MHPELILALALALAFAFTNGFLDAANAIATLVSTRSATPGQAIVIASIFNMLGPLLVGAAVANMIGSLVHVTALQTVPVIICGLGSAVLWNFLAWWRGIPSSSGHALVGGLSGAAIASGGLGAVAWGGFKGWHPVGVLGTLSALAISPVLGAVVALLLIRLLGRLSRRWSVHMRGCLRAGQWLASSALAFSHGSNDAQKSVGVIAAILLASGQAKTMQASVWIVLACATALTFGTALGGWRVVKTIGRRIYRLTSLDGLASQLGSTAVILSASFIGAPVSTTHVVSSSVVGVGTGRRHWRRVRWGVVREILLTWITTLPGTGLIAAVFYLAFRACSG